MLNKSTNKYVISTQSDDRVVRYFAVDTYPYWTPNLNNAKYFNTIPDISYEIGSHVYMKINRNEIYVNEVILHTIDVFSEKTLKEAQLEKRKQELRKKIEEAELELNSLK